MSSSASHIPAASPRPLVAVPACRKIIEPHPFHGAGEKYLSALSDAAGVAPLLVPALGDARAWRDVIARVDGVFLTGSPSNVEPHRYGGAPSVDGTLHDVERDATSLPFIRAALAAGLPLLAVCRGAQELNVVLGGTLHQRIQELPGMLDHRGAPDRPMSEAYAPAHSVHLARGGMLRALAGAERVMVNSLHAQGVDRLCQGAVIEATADDGLIEAFRIERSGIFTLAIQWHPEWQVMDNPLSRAIFRQFSEACRARIAGVQHANHRAVV